MSEKLFFGGQDQLAISLISAVLGFGGLVDVKKKRKKMKDSMRMSEIALTENNNRCSGCCVILW